MATRARKSGTAQRTRGGGRRSSPESAAASPTPDPVPFRVPGTALTALQLAFAQHYHACHVGAEAYRLATGGKRAKNHRERAYQLLKMPAVQAHLAGLAAAEAGDIKARKELRIGVLIETMLDVDVKRADRLRALELSGKIDGDFVEQHEVTVLNEGRAERMKRGRDRASAPTAVAVGMVS